MPTQQCSEASGLTNGWDAESVRNAEIGNQICDVKGNAPRTSRPTIPTSVTAISLT
jgi:hypothetical protein